MTSRTIEALEFYKITETLAGYAASAEAKDRLLALAPSRDIGHIERELKRVEEVRRLIQRSGVFPGGGADIRLLLKRASLAGASLSEPELFNILLHLRIHHATSKLAHREAERMPLFHQLTRPLEPVPDLEQSLESALTPDATLRDTASNELARLRRAVADQMERLRARLSALIPKLARQGLLREESFSIRDGRYVLPVRSDAMGGIKGIVHDRSATGGTLFVEPTALIDLGNELRSLELAERDEVRRILRELTAAVRKHIDQIEVNEAVVTAVDVIWAKAQLAEKLDAYEPVITTNGALRILGGRHPLLVLYGDRDVVPLNLELGDEFGMLVISGPNAGGKSVALKSVGLMAIMASCGLHIPALPGTEIPIYYGVEADIGDRQSISDDLSTFTAHATRLKEILATATPRTLVLIDEIGAGTDPQEGASLSIAALESLLTRRVPTIVTTHHSALKAFAHASAWCANGSMEFDLAHFRPTYKFRAHIPGSSYALDIAKRAGLPEDLIARARELVGSERSRLEEIITSLSEKLVKYEGMVQDQQQRGRVIKAQEEDYARKVERLREREKQLKHQGMREIEELLKAARKTIESTVKELREKGAVATHINTARDAIQQVAKSASEKLKVPTVEVPQPPSRDIPIDPIPQREAVVGDWVTVDGGNVPGQVTAIAAKGDRLCVSVGALQLWVTRDRTELVEPPESRQVKPVSMNRLPEVPFELDVRGLDAGEAMLRVDRYLYDGSVTGRTKLGIIHGKGAGILARHIQRQLKNHPLVASFRFGEYGEGDYGVTIVDLKG